VATSAVTDVDGLRARWRQRSHRLHRWLDRRVALDRWYPHVPIALATAPLGVLMVVDASERMFGVRPHLVRLAEIAQHATVLRHTPIVEAAVGISLVTISLGLLARSRLAWLWSVVATGIGLSMRIPPRGSDLSFVVYFALLLAVLIVYRSRFRSRNVAASGVFASAVVLSFLLWATLGTLRLGAQFRPPIDTLTDAFYFTFVAISSVGFGDITPQTPEARLFVVAMIFAGLVVAATTFSTILVPLIGNRMREIAGGEVEMDRSNHYVIVGRSALARNAATELASRGQRVTLVLEEAPTEDFYKKWDVVVGDPTDLSVLRDAGAERARGVLALSVDDATNGFVVLGVNEIDPTITTVVTLNDPKNEFRLKRTQPSLTLSLQALGGELLAMALTGEHVDVEMLRKALQLQTSEPGPAARS
jgi:voltage-gated potassium channel